MDILRKMFKITKENENPSSSDDNDFRKPGWFDKSEDELFGENRKFAVEVFTNPMELQKHFEQQVQRMMEALNEYEENAPKLEKHTKEEYLKPGFEEDICKAFQKHRDMLDTDLDGEIYADQLHSLMQRVSPENGKMIPHNRNLPKVINPKRKLTDEETIMGRIHGTIRDDDSRPSKANLLSPNTKAPFGGVFEGTYSGPRMFRQSIMTKTIRKPDGSYEIIKVTQDSQGNTTTTKTSTKNGKSESVTSYSRGDMTGSKSIESTPNSNPNIYVSQQGYALPRNLW